MKTRLLAAIAAVSLVAVGTASPAVASTHQTSSATLRAINQSDFGSKDALVGTQQSYVAMDMQCSGYRIEAVGANQAQTLFGQDRRIVAPDMKLIRVAAAGRTTATFGTANDLLGASTIATSANQPVLTANAVVLQAASGS